jgi:deazaflavin-dependent oxidoreductase (nitroreductase family)
MAVDAGMKLLNVAHRSVLAVTRGRALTSVFGMPTVELHTIGRSSGQRRSTLLTMPISGPDRVVLVASKGGDDRNPDWYLNLRAHPEVELTIGGATKPMVARTVSDAERAELWPEIVSKYKGYAAYQARTERQIPVVVCEPSARRCKGVMTSQSGGAVRCR